MPHHFSTPFDQDSKTKPRLESAKERRFPWKRFLADSCYISLKSASFAVATFLMTLGLPLFFFLLIAGWNMDMLFLQVDNLAARYLAADAARQLAFSGDLKIGFFALAGLAAIWRLPRFVADLERVLVSKAEK